jgi:hypothetical protein
VACSSPGSEVPAAKNNVKGFAVMSWKLLLLTGFLISVMSEANDLADESNTQCYHILASIHLPVQMVGVLPHTAVPQHLICHNLDVACQDEHHKLLISSPRPEPPLRICSLNMEYVGKDSSYPPQPTGPLVGCQGNPETKLSKPVQDLLHDDLPQQHLGRDALQCQYCWRVRPQTYHHNTGLCQAQALDSTFQLSSPIQRELQYQDSKSVLQRSGHELQLQQCVLGPGQHLASHPAKMAKEFRSKHFKTSLMVYLHTAANQDGHRSQWDNRVDQQQAETLLNLNKTGGGLVDGAADN